MKKITVSNVQNCVGVVDKENSKVMKFELEGPEEMDASDGYHTFTELYEHRIALWIALLRALGKVEWQDYPAWRSKLHADGTMFDGWFILGRTMPDGKQITYHLPMSKWEETNFAETLEKAPEWDGHTPNDVLERLKNL